MDEDTQLHYRNKYTENVRNDFYFAKFVLSVITTMFHLFYQLFSFTKNIFLSVQNSRSDDYCI